MAIGLDKDCSQGRVYWSDISNKQIVSVKYDGTDRQIFINDGKVTDVEVRRLPSNILMFFRYYLAGRNCY